MDNRRLYEQKARAQLNEWKAELDRLRAKASGASAEVQLELNRQIQALEKQIGEGAARLNKLATAGDEAWDSVREGCESAWQSLRDGFTKAASKFRR